ncbi:O-acetyl-ADP-ribose deacetylase [Tessaracoccus flavus]|uniref:O-acetyl-ADP-ribose deacetylase n=1 Tax=Tessaracoccus flavus TaxID=1610493 RepID=A0A1Q2CBE0_9ACTN|nr:O-acetyl-ADP-ribose deacetylase [Tessaracoccus flavus]AQP43421.1 O-acetyl-ADP-ribose deacetylase [Tessaracoccus flavus]SDZ05001.1 O-acetyl-ADP-ribose deacetylase (regulator of RNase III), contains Macro domain [Tessaracoccus flavus]
MTTPALEAVLGDITTQRVDAIVNAANSSLLGGGGVDGAIHRAAGPGLVADCRQLRMTELPDGLPTGEAVATDAHRLPARWVIHTVGPNRHAGQSDPALLAACFRNSLTLASSLGARSIALPAVSAGIYGWDADEVAQVAVDAVRSTEAPGVELVRFVLFSARLLDAFKTALAPTAD